MDMESGNHPRVTITRDNGKVIGRMEKVLLNIRLAHIRDIFKTS